MMNNLQSSAFVAKNLLNVLQGYTKGIRLLLIILTMFVLNIGQMYGYTITFNGSASESTSLSTSTKASEITGNSTYVTGNLVTATKVYGATSDGVKLGTSSAAGTIKFNLSTTGQVTPTSIVVNCKLYNSTKSATLKVNGSATQNVPSSSGNLTFIITSSITYIELVSNKYIWVKSVTVNTATGSTTYKVTYNANGATSGTVPEDDTNYTSGTTVTVKSNSGTLAKTGHTFGGWNTNSSGTGTNYTAGSGTFNITGNTTLYAKWTAKQSTITIDPNTTNHGTGSNVSVTATYGQALPSFTACTPATGYELVGYYTSATGGTKVIGKDGKLVASISGYTDANAKWINESASLTLYAQYSAKNYTVTYAGNSGTTSCTGGTYTYNSSFVICLDIPTRTGYSFTGWSDGTNIYQPGDNYTMPAKNVTFTAQWQINTYKVKWNVDGSEKEEDVNYNSKPTGAPTIDPNNLPCEGADKFVGWTTGEYKGDSAPTTLYPTADDIPAITGDVTFYAVFADYEQ